MLTKSAQKRTLPATWPPTNQPRINNLQPILNASRPPPPFAGNRLNRAQISEFRETVAKQTATHLPSHEIDRRTIESVAATSSVPETSLIQSAPQPARILHLWHLTSLDAPTVAVVWALAFARAAHVALPWWIPAILALGTWSVYIGDRLLDVYLAARRNVGPLRERHHFHWRHRRLFLAFAAVATSLSLVLILRFMPIAARERNSGLALAALLYFTGVHGKWRLPAQLRISPKEPLVGAIFTLACAAPTWARAGNRLELLPAVLCFTLLAWLNCHAIEVWESVDTPPSASIDALGTLLSAVCIASAGALGAFHLRGQTALLSAAAGSALLLALLDRRKDGLTPLSLRACADLALLTPAALLVLL